MTMLLVVALAVAAAGCASTGGWRTLQIDGTDEVRFDESLSNMYEVLNTRRRYILERTLLDIWIIGAGTAADARLQGDEESYSARDYLSQVDGLTYDELIALADPTGERTRQYRRALSREEFYAVTLGGPIAANGGVTVDSIATNARAYVDRTSVPGQ